jgi:hypothetical protein
MNQNIEIALKQAFGLIEAGNLEDAKALLRPILESEKDNADVWWLYSHAVTDAETARLALNNVLRIDPNYPDARDLLNQLEAQQTSDQSDDILEMGKDPSFIPAMPSSIPGITPLAPRPDSAGNKGFDVSDELPDEMFGDEEPEAFYRRPVFYIPIIVLLLIGALAIVIIKPFAVNAPTPEATLQATQSTALEIPTSESIANGESTLTSIPTVVVDTTAAPEAVTDLSGVSTAFAGFTLSSDKGVEIADSSLGKTLTVTVCTTGGREMRELLPKAMETLAKASVNYASQAQVIAVKMSDCAANSTLLLIGATIEDATAFANGRLADKDFQAKWQPIK